MLFHLSRRAISRRAISRRAISRRAMSRRAGAFSLAGAIALTCLLLPAFDAAAADQPRVRLVTSMGNIDVELFPEKAPRTVTNFLWLVDDGFYDGLIFHRVIANFMIQTGGYDAGMTERQAPGTVANESFNGLHNRAGTLAMARLDDPESASSQFFINVNDNAHLDAAPGLPGYTVFGRVIAGMDVVTDIELADTGIRGGMAGVPDTPIVLERAERLP